MLLSIRLTVLKVCEDILRRDETFQPIFKKDKKYFEYHNNAQFFVFCVIHMYVAPVTKSATTDVNKGSSSISLFNSNKSIKLKQNRVTKQNRRNTSTIEGKQQTATNINDNIQRNRVFDSNYQSLTWYMTM